MNADQGKQFEKDVYEFVKALDPKAQVLFNHKVPDKDTGSLRQVDAWINAKFGDHIPISILVSCKDYKRKLNITHIESFAQEVQSTGASTGVIYSSSGFTQNALQKARVRGLNCCRFFRNDPAEMPNCIRFWAYACMPQIVLSLGQLTIPDIVPKGVIYWTDLLAVQLTPTKTLSNCIAEQFHQGEKMAIADCSRDKLFPKDWIFEFTFGSDALPSLQGLVRVVGHWKTYRGRLEAHLLQGSYTYLGDSFRGSVRSPYIDTQGPHPGPGWEEIDPSTTSFPTNRVLAILHHPDIEKTLAEHFANKPVNLPPTPPHD